MGLLWGVEGNRRTTNRTEMSNPKKIQTVYVYSFMGDHVETLESAHEAADKYQIKGGASALKISIKRQSIVNQKYYFSYSDKFKVPVKKKNFNPFLSTSIKGKAEQK